MGRWERPSTKQREDIKVLLANHDSCGDILCGNPVSLNEIETILKKKTIKIKINKIKMMLLSSILSLSCILTFFSEFS